MSVESHHAIHGVELDTVPGVALQVALPLSSTPQPVTQSDGAPTGLQLTLSPGPVNVATDLNVSGAVTMDTSLNVAGTATVGGLNASLALITADASVDGTLVAATLGVTGAATFNGALSAESVDVTGPATVSGDLAANGALTARGRVSLFSGAPLPIPIPGTGRRTASYVAGTDGFVIMAGAGTLNVAPLTAEAQRTTPAMLPVQAGGTFTLNAQAATTAYFMQLGQVTPAFR